MSNIADVDARGAVANGVQPVCDRYKATHTYSMRNEVDIRPVAGRSRECTANAVQLIRDQRLLSAQTRLRQDGIE